MNTKITKNKMLYRLEHNHYTDGYLQNIYIGLFSSKMEAEKIIDKLIIQPGFKLHPKICFNIIEIIVDDYYWKKGFYRENENDIEIK